MFRVGPFRHTYLEAFNDCDHRIFSGKLAIIRIKRCPKVNDVQNRRRSDLESAIAGLSLPAIHAAVQKAATDFFYEIARNPKDSKGDT